MSIQEAFNQVCNEAKAAEGYYVSLMVQTSQYGGPEEGGWWRNDTHVVAYQHFDTEEAAQAAKDAVEVLAKELADESRKQHGDKCLREMDWCEARGLEADYLPEPDGPNEYYVLVSEGLPKLSLSPSTYE